MEGTGLGNPTEAVRKLRRAVRKATKAQTGTWSVDEAAGDGRTWRRIMEKKGTSQERENREAFLILLIIIVYKQYKIINNFCLY